jgi:hypothetical protein
MRFAPQPLFRSWPSWGREYLGRVQALGGLRIAAPVAARLAAGITAFITSIFAAFLSPVRQGGQAAHRAAWAGCSAAAVLLAVLPVGLAAASPAGEVHVVGPDGIPASLEEALARAGDGAVIELLPGDYAPTPRVFENRRLTLRGLGETRPRFDGDGRVEVHNALWTVRGGELTVENIDIRGMRSRDGSGAALRLEAGRLVVRQAWLYDNEHGILAVNEPTAELVIEDSAFGMAPRVRGGLHHLLTVGRIASLSVTGSRFQQGFEGHLIRSRAQRTEIAYNMIHDGPRGGVSYEIELPVGGDVTIIGNVIGQGRDTQNFVMVAYGSEGTAWERNVLRLSHNTFLNYRRLPGWMLRVWSDRLPADTEIVAVNNLLVGGGVFSLGNKGVFEGNRHARFSQLTDAGTYAFEPAMGSSVRGKGVDPRRLSDDALMPRAQFRWPVGIEAIEPPAMWTPGAFQR